MLIIDSDMTLSVTSLDESLSAAASSLSSKLADMEDANSLDVVVGDVILRATGRANCDEHGVVEEEEFNERLSSSTPPQR